jgi:hypothetical protein
MTDFPKLIHDIAEHLAKAMPSNSITTVTSPGSMVANILIDQEDRGLEVWCEPKKMRLEVRGMKPSSNDDEEFPSVSDETKWVKPIHMSATRSPLALAFEIHKRMFPTYLTKFAEACKLRDEYEEGLKRQRLHVVAFHRLVQGEVNYDTGEVWQTREDVGAGGRVQKIEVVLDLADLRFQGVPVHIAKKMVALWVEESKLHEQTGRTDPAG